jgi:hypothetical protein
VRHLAANTLVMLILGRSESAWPAELILSQQSRLETGSQRHGWLQVTHSDSVEENPIRRPGLAAQAPSQPEACQWPGPAGGDADGEFSGVKGKRT